MLSFELSDFMWVRGRTEPIHGVLHDSDGRALDLTGKTLSMLIKQDNYAAEVACSFDHDISVPARTCPAPDATYPNNDLIFGDAAFDFPSMLLPGAYLYFQKTGEVRIYSRQAHFVNDHYVTLFIELPEQLDATWTWWASNDSPTYAKRGMFRFSPNISAMDDIPFDMQAKLVNGSSTDFSARLTGRVITPIQP